MHQVSISRQTARRFVLGKQGLWPGRRWQGLDGVAQALHAVERVQLDPLCVLARSHELALLSRVEGFSPAHLDTVLFERREAFDFGDTLFIQPMAELPYWRAIMRRKRTEPRWQAFAEAHAGLLAEVKAELRARGPLGNRDFDGKVRVNSYRASKDTGLVLFYLWLTGELMTHHRVRFERVFDFAENIAPAAYAYEAPLEAAEAFLVRKAIAFWGLCRPRYFGALLERKCAAAESALWAKQLAEVGEVVPVAVEGQRELHYVLAADLPLLETAEAGRASEPWAAVMCNAEEEVSFLAPLDIVSARGRARELFDFDYVWEVYKPAAQRRWGYYTLPILYGDCLAARADLKFERKTRVLHVLGFWLEEEASGSDSAFAAALARGLRRLVDFVGAQELGDGPVRAVCPAYVASPGGWAR
ncbi:MAG: YcaQ family DNA glycosylase [Anaerolineae bacterium]|nr:YcaQ family DNA glycosylase [Anaerolineae bacterium]